LVAAVFAQQKPVWPQAASASIFVEGWDRERPEERHFFRWFYDQAAGKERLDGIQRHRGELYWTETIVDTVQKREYFVVHQGSLVACYNRPHNRSLPSPNFDRAVFVGKAEIGYRVVNHWVERSPEGRDVHSIYDRVDNGQIVRVDNHREERAVVFHFHEFDVGTQDSSLFVLPDAIKAICNIVNEDTFLQ
jgi:hypothetical protein